LLFNEEGKINFSFADLSRNRLRMIALTAFNNLSNLTHLDLSYNKLPSLDVDYMCHLRKLHVLNISGNVQLNLLNVRMVLHNLTTLNSLSMADITDMPLDMFASLTELRFLNVSGTRLGNDTAQVLEPLKSLKVNYLIF
jgi:Leucine-rich repeat (LRR) protein